MTAQNTPLVSVLVLCTSPRGHNDSSTEAGSLQFPYILCGWFGQSISLPRVEAGVRKIQGHPQVLNERKDAVGHKNR